MLQSPHAARRALQRRRTIKSSGLPSILDPNKAGTLASEAGRPEPSDELTFSGVTAVKLGNPTSESVPLAAFGGKLAEVRKKRRCFVICGRIAHDDQILYLAPSGFSALGR
jgi:hypothetical protein